MADWAEQYLVALKARDSIEKANVRLYEHCTRVEDEKAELAQQIAESGKTDTGDEKTPAAAGGSTGTGTSPTIPSAVISPTPYLFRVSSPQPPPPPQPVGGAVAEIRADLAQAQQERNSLQQQVEVLRRQLETVTAKSSRESKRLVQTTAQVAQLTTKLRDRDEELKGKAKLVEDVQDENMTLNLQLNVAEEQAQKLKAENQHLIDRWMARMGKEADRMNEETETESRRIKG